MEIEVILKVRNLKIVFISLIFQKQEGHQIYALL